MLRLVEAVTTKSPKYRGRCTKQLHHLYDFKAMFNKLDSGLGGFATSNFSGDGYHDFLVSLDENEEEPRPILNVK